MKETEQLRLRIERRKIRNINIYLRPPYKEVLVTAPMKAPTQRIEAFLLEKQDWIRRNLERLRSEKQESRLGAFLPAAERKRLAEELDRMAPPLFRKWGEQLGVHAQAVSYRRMRRCYGVCHTGKRTITLNVYLGETPEELLEYIIVHELCHLREANHNQRFYALLSGCLPDWKERKRRLNEFFRKTGAGAGKKGKPLEGRAETDKKR